MGIVLSIAVACCWFIFDQNAISQIERERHHRLRFLGLRANNQLLSNFIYRSDLVVPKPGPECFLGTTSEELALVNAEDGKRYLLRIERRSGMPRDVESLGRAVKRDFIDYPNIPDIDTGKYFLDAYIQDGCVRLNIHGSITEHFDEEPTGPSIDEYAALFTTPAVVAISVWFSICALAWISEGYRDSRSNDRIGDP